MDRRTAAASEVASGVTGERVGTAASAEVLRGVGSSGSLPALGEAVGLPRSGASSCVDSHRAGVCSREFGSLAQSVPQFSGKLEDFPLWKERLLPSTVGCMSSLLAVHDMMIGDLSKVTQYFLSQGLTLRQLE